MKKLNYPICFSSIFGGAIAVIIDLLTNDNAAVTLKIHTIFATQFGWKIGGEWVILCIALIPPVICWILDTPSKKEALMTGLSVFAFLNVATPYKGAIKQEPIPVNSIGLNSQNSFGIFTASSFDQPNKENPIYLASNATIIENDWISSCKPSYSGPMGLRSLLNNSINFCPIGDDHLETGDRIRIIEIWDTDLRGYRYVKIQYMRTNKVMIGWIWAGKKPSYWSQVLPDDEDNIGQYSSPE